MAGTRKQSKTHVTSEIRDVFTEFDRSGKGYINVDDLRAIMMRCVRACVCVCVCVRAYVPQAAASLMAQI